MPITDNSIMPTLKFTAKLDCRKALEQLLFFNVNQPRVRQGEALAVERWESRRFGFWK